jgi:hypothetical protein
MLFRLELIPRSRFPAFLTGSVAEEASIAAQQSCECVFAIVRTFDHFSKSTTARRFCHRRSSAKQNLANFESLSGDNEATSVDGFRIPQHQKRVLVKNLLR